MRLDEKEIPDARLALLWLADKAGVRVDGVYEYEEDEEVWGRVRICSHCTPLENERKKNKTKKHTPQVKPQLVVFISQRPYTPRDFFYFFFRVYLGLEPFEP